MVLLLLACFIASAVTIYKKSPEITIEQTNLTSFFNGDWANNLIDEFEDKLIVKETAVGLWGAINYGIFNTGNKKVIIGNDGWLFTEEEFISYPKAFEEEQKKIGIIKQVDRYLASQDIQLIVALIPSKARIYEDHLGRFLIPDDKQELYKRFQKNLNRNNIIAHNLLTVFQHQKNRGAQMFLKQDTHWTPVGATITAYILSSYGDDIERPSKEFLTTLGEATSYEADLKKYVQTGFFENWIGLKKETYTPHTTQSKETHDDLFSDPVLPITLIGTSYSAIQKWNFEGALKTAFKADVLNLSIEGKGPMYPMAEYLNNEDFSNSHTKIVIWEIPERFIQKPYDDIIFPDIITEVNP